MLLKRCTLSDEHFNCLLSLNQSCFEIIFIDLQGQYGRTNNICCWCRSLRKCRRCNEQRKS